MEANALLDRLASGLPITLAHCICQLVCLFNLACHSWLSEYLLTPCNYPAFCLQHTVYNTPASSAWFATSLHLATACWKENSFQHHMITWQLAERKDRERYTEGSRRKLPFLSIYLSISIPYNIGLLHKYSYLGVVLSICRIT